MEKKNYIYAFLHIPKTAGMTFRYHILKYFNKDQHLYLGAEALGLWHSERRANSTDLKNAVCKKVERLSKEMREKIKIIHGHELIYGVHEYFDKPVRYFAFFRDPVERTVSLYNHYREQYFDFKKEGKKLDDLKINFLVNGKVPEFDEWLDRKYNKKGRKSFLAIYQRLWLNGFIGDKDNIDTDDLLQKFWFVGLVDNFDEESLFLYKNIGIKGFFVNQNISEKYFRLSEHSKMRSKIIKRNKEDILIFNAAKKYHKISLKRQTNYDEIVREMRKRRKILLPITQFIYAPRDTVKLMLNTFN